MVLKNIWTVISPDRNVNDQWSKMYEQEFLLQGIGKKGMDVDFPQQHWVKMN